MLPCPTSPGLQRGARVASLHYPILRLARPRAWLTGAHRAAFQTRRIFARHSFGMKWNENAEGKLRKLLEYGGQGRNRTADLSLFRAAYRSAEVVLTMT